MTRMILTYWSVAAYTRHVDAVELNVELRVDEIAGGVISEVQPRTHHYHHHPQPRPPGGGLHAAGLPWVQRGRARCFHHDNAIWQPLHRIWSEEQKLEYFNLGKEKVSIKGKTLFLLFYSYTFDSFVLCSTCNIRHI